MVRVERMDVLKAAKSQTPTLVVSMTLCVIYLFAMSYNQFLGRVEGSINPVVDNVRITSVKPVGDSSVEIYGEADKLRSCRYIDTRWFYTDGEDMIPARIQFLEGTKIRPTGGFSFGPWVINMTPEQFTTGSRSEVIHSCHWLFDTVSRFYDSKEN